jgi:hypothetical protein
MHLHRCSIGLLDQRHLCDVYTAVISGLPEVVVHVLLVCYGDQSNDCSNSVSESPAKLEVSSREQHLQSLKKVTDILDLPQQISEM